MSDSIGYNFRKFARKFTEFPLVEIKDKIINHKSINKIPQNVYQTWETRSLGKTHAKSIQEFREKNPTFSFTMSSAPILLVIMRITFVKSTFFPR